MPAHGEVVPDVSGSTLTDVILLYAPYMCQGVLTFIICTIVTYIPAEGAFRSSGLSYILFITVAEIMVLRTRLTWRAATGPLGLVLGSRR